MTSIQIWPLLRTAAVTAGILGGLAAPALAQNWEASHQLRAGLFLQGGHTDFDGTLNGASQSNSAGATGFGVTAGAELLRARGWTFGLESDFGQTGAVNATVVNARFSGDYFGSFRGRVGFHVMDNWVLYGTGGLGLRGLTITDSSGGKGEKTLYGGVYGGGSEWHQGNTIFFVEYLHSQYQNADVAVNFAGIPPLIPASVTNYRAAISSDAIRLGVKFKLGFDNYTDDVPRGIRK